MVIVILMITALLILAIAIALISLFKWTYSKSGAKSFIKSKR